MTISWVVFISIHCDIIRTPLDMREGKIDLQREINTINPLSANPTKWSNTHKQFIGNLLTNSLSVFDHFVGLALKGLTI